MSRWIRRLSCTASIDRGDYTRIDRRFEFESKQSGRLVQDWFRVYRARNRAQLLWWMSRSRCRVSTVHYLFVHRTITDIYQTGLLDDSKRPCDWMRRRNLSSLLLFRRIRRHARSPNMRQERISRTSNTSHSIHPSCIRSTCTRLEAYLDVQSRFHRHENEAYSAITRHDGHTVA